MTKTTNAKTIKVQEAEALAATSSAVPTPNSETISTVVVETKASKARAVFAQCYAQSPVPQRKDIIALAMKESGLTKAGASTYLQNYKDKKGLSVKKTPTTA